jgi:hypothetical protein
MPLPAAYAAQRALLADADISFLPLDGIIIPTAPLTAEVREFVRSQQQAAHPSQPLLLAEDVVPKFRFVLFSADFIKLQLSVTQALTLPIITDDFDAKYGTFSKRAEVVNCVNALGDLNAHCANFGNPATLAREIQALATGTKPSKLYGQIVWLAQQIATTADTFKFTMQSLNEELPSVDDNQTRYEILKELLLGEGGLVGEAMRMETETKKLRNDILAYLDRMREIKTPIHTYFGSSSDIYEEAKAQNKEIAKKLTETQAELESTRADYIKYVVAASAGSVGLFIFTGGMLWPVSAVVGGVLGDLAEKARKRANEMEAKMSTLSGEAKKKASLVADVNALTTSITPIDEYLQMVCNGLGTIGGVWTNMVVKLHAIVDRISPEVMQDLSAITQKLRIMEGQKRWAEVAKGSYDFTANAFVEIG